MLKIENKVKNKQMFVKLPSSVSGITIFPFSAALIINGENFPIKLSSKLSALV
jgi:hypothetical protein